MKLLNIESGRYFAVLERVEEDAALGSVAVAAADSGYAAVGQIFDRVWAKTRRGGFPHAFARWVFCDAYVSRRGGDTHYVAIKHVAVAEYCLVDTVAVGFAQLLEAEGRGGLPFPNDRLGGGGVGSVKVDECERGVELICKRNNATTGQRLLGRVGSFGGGHGCALRTHGNVDVYVGHLWNIAYKFVNCFHDGMSISVYDYTVAVGIGDTCEIPAGLSRAGGGAYADLVLMLRAVGDKVGGDVHPSRKNALQIACGVCLKL